MAMKNINIFKNIILLLLLAVCVKLFTDSYFTKVSEKEFAKLKSSYQNLLEIRKSIDSFIRQTAMDEGRQIIINKSSKYSKYNIVQVMRNRVMSEMSLKSESINLPFMFIIDKANKIRQVFAHVKEDKTRTVHYLKAIVNNYLN